MELVLNFGGRKMSPTTIKENNSDHITIPENKKSESDTSKIKKNKNDGKIYDVWFENEILTDEIDNSTDMYF